MINAYEVGATLKLHDLISPALLKIAEQLEKLEGRIIKINSHLGQMQRVSYQLKGLGNEFKSVASNAKLMQENLGKASNTTLKLKERLATVSGAAVEKAAVETGGLSKELTNANLHAMSLRNTMRNLGAGGVATAVGSIASANRRAAGGAGGSGGAVGSGGNGGGSGGRHTGLHGGMIHAGAGGIGIGQVGLSTGDAMPMLIGGAMIGWGLKSTLAPAAAYQGAVNRFAGLNLGAATNADAQRFANSQNLYGVNSIDMMNQLRDLHTVMGNYEHAKELAPLFARMEFTNRAVYGEHGNKMDQGQLADLGRVIDMRNAWRSPAEMRRNADMMQHVVSGTGGMVLPSQYRLMMGTGGIAAKNLSADSFYYAMEPIIQEMKSGSKVGTALMSAHQNLGMGRTTKRAAEMLAGLGLIGQSDVLKSGFVAGSLKGESLRQANPVEWVNQVLVPAITNNLVKNHKPVTEAAILNMINALMTNRTGANLYSMFYQQQEKIRRAMGIDRNAMGINQIGAMADKSYAGNVEAFHKQFEEFKKTIGLIILPHAIEFLKGMTSAIKDLTQWAKENPVKVKILTGAFVALSGALLFSGTVVLLTAAFRGLAGVLGFAGVANESAVALRGLGAATAMSSAGGATGILRVATALGPAGLAAAIIGIGAAVALTIKGIKAWREYNDKHLQHVPGTAPKSDGLPKPIVPDKNHPSDGHLGPWGQWLHDRFSGGKAAPKSASPVNRFSKPYDPYGNAFRDPMVKTGKHDKVAFINNTIQINGRTLAQTMTREQIRMSNGPQSGTSGVDYSATMAPLA